MRVRLAVGDDFATLDLFTFEHVQVAPLRNQLLVLLTLLVRDDQATLALGFLAVADRARVLGEDRGVLRLASFEQVGHSRQTAGDVAGLRRFLRDTRDNVTDRHLRTVFQADDRARGQRVHSRNIGVGERDFLALRH